MADLRTSTLPSLNEIGLLLEGEWSDITKVMILETRIKMKLINKPALCAQITVLLAGAHCYL